MLGKRGIWLSNIVVCIVIYFIRCFKSLFIIKFIFRSFFERFLLNILNEMFFIFGVCGYISFEEYYYIIDFFYDIMYDGYNEFIRNFYFVVLEFDEGVM